MRRLRGFAAPIWLVLALASSETLACGPSAPPPVSSQAQSKWVGYDYVALAPGLERGSSSLLGPLDGTTYGLAEVWSGVERMVWLQKRVGYEPSGRARWQVEAVLELPRLEPGELVLLGGACTLAGTVTPELIVIAKESQGPLYAPVRGAWRAQPSKSRFDAVPTSSIECPNPDGDESGT